MRVSTKNEGYLIKARPTEITRRKKAKNESQFQLNAKNTAHMIVLIQCHVLCMCSVHSLLFLFTFVQKMCAVHITVFN